MENQNAKLKVRKECRVRNLSSKYTSLFGEMVIAGGEGTEKGELCYCLFLRWQRFECIYADRMDKVGKERLREKE